uniref:non-specific serine/threonine protein kinase n=1 Tax=Aegilops tauschii subsp. strangulata TaxID=200361 RepID=A0A453JEY2_AEGTS
HDRSRTPVWAATAGSTIIQSIILSLNASGLYISDPADQSGPSWSTPRLAAPVAALRLLDTGQLALIDGDNATLWSTFDAPTDTLLQGQVLPVGVPLTATASEQDLSPGAYRLLLTPTDALLQWASSSSNVRRDEDLVTYWALSSDPASVQDSNRAVRSMMVNASGIYLLADDDGRDTVFSLRFASPPAPATRMLLKVDPSGRLRALSTAYSPTAARATLPAVWAAPASDCDLPLPCGSLGLCTPGNNGSSCMCPDAFTTHTTGGCSPADGSSLPVLSDSCLAGNLHEAGRRDRLLRQQVRAPHDGRRRALGLPRPLLGQLLLRRLRLQELLQVLPPPAQPDRLRLPRRRQQRSRRRRLHQDGPAGSISRPRRGPRLLVPQHHHHHIRHRAARRGGRVHHLPAVRAGRALAQEPPPCRRQHRQGQEEEARPRRQQLVHAAHDAVLVVVASVVQRPLREGGRRRQRGRRRRGAHPGPAHPVHVRRPGDGDKRLQVADRLRRVRLRVPRRAPRPDHRGRQADEQPGHAGPPRVPHGDRRHRQRAPREPRQAPRLLRRGRAAAAAGVRVHEPRLARPVPLLPRRRRRRREEEGRAGVAGASRRLRGGGARAGVPTRRLRPQDPALRRQAGEHPAGRPRRRQDRRLRAGQADEPGAVGAVHHHARHPRVPGAGVAHERAHHRQGRRLQLRHGAAGDRARPQELQVVGWRRRRGDQAQEQLLPGAGAGPARGRAVPGAGGPEAGGPGRRGGGGEGGARGAVLPPGGGVGAAGHDGRVRHARRQHGRVRA